MRAELSPIGAESPEDVSELRLFNPDSEPVTVEIRVQGDTQAELDVPPGSASAFVVGQLLTPGTVELELVASRGRQVLDRADFTFSLDRDPDSVSAKVADALRAAGHPVVVTEPWDSSVFPYSDAALTPWFDRPDALDRVRGMLASGTITSQESRHLNDFVTSGYLIVEDALSPDLLTRALAAIDNMVQAGFSGYTWGSSQRIEHAHASYPAFREVTEVPVIWRLLELIFGTAPRVCQTLTYVFGSQQGAHQDTIHLTPFPAGYMCGVWVALEDVRPGSGELVYFPGSHRAERVYMNSVGARKVTDGDWTQFGELVIPRWQTLLEEGGFRAERFLPRAGTALIWHENLMHEGSARTDPTLSRKSVVTHYFGSGPVAYYDSSGLPARFAAPQYAVDH